MEEELGFLVVYIYYVIFVCLFEVVVVLKGEYYWEYYGSVYVFIVYKLIGSGVIVCVGNLYVCLKILFIVSLLVICLIIKKF